MSRLTALLKALPFCCGLMFIAAAEDDCVIRIVTDDGDGADCEEVQDVCNLDCVLATNDEGCEICECVTDPPPPEGCESDADCGDGQICEFLESCPPCANEPGTAQCDAPCSYEGVCVDVQPDPCGDVLCSPDTFCAVDESGQPVCLPIDGELCFGDSDCGERAFCDFSTCNGSSDGNEPAPPDDSGDNDQDIACLGTCKELNEPVGCENVLCQDGTICVEGFNGPECVPVESQCNTDEDCAANGQGGRCEVSCLPMPDCPECDACLVVGQCVNDNPDECAALCGPGQECRINDDGSVECADVSPPECTGDADCESGNCNADEVCLPDPSCDAQGNDLVACDAVCWGYCVEPQPASCFEDAECAAGEICEVVESCPPCGDSEPNCLAPCFIEGHCVPANTDPPQP